MRISPKTWRSSERETEEGPITRTRHELHQPGERSRPPVQLVARDAQLVAQPAQLRAQRLQLAAQRLRLQRRRRHARAQRLALAPAELARSDVHTLYVFLAFSFYNSRTWNIVSEGLK